MGYVIMVKEWIKTEGGIRDYTYEEYNGVVYQTVDEALEEADKEFLGEYYIAEKEY